jgi:hypothetical protein
MNYNPFALSSVSAVGLLLLMHWHTHAHWLTHLRSTIIGKTQKIVHSIVLKELI